MSLEWIASEFSGHVVSGDHDHWRVLGTLKLSLLKNGITLLFWAISVPSCGFGHLLV